MHYTRKEHLPKNMIIIEGLEMANSLSTFDIVAEKTLPKTILVTNHAGAE